MVSELLYNAMYILEVTLQIYTSSARVGTLVASIIAAFLVDGRNVAIEVFLSHGLERAQ